MFDFNLAFERNIGWLNPDEQHRIQQACIAVPGLGGVGGNHLLSLTRLGVGAFHIADLDHFELANFNRQAGATMSTLGETKVDVLEAMARDINPELKIRTFPQGVDADNVDQFLTGVDCLVDGLDFFALEARKTVFRTCAERGIPAITAAPLGWGTSMLVFMPGGMTFDEYFQLDGLSAPEQLVRFLVGLSPESIQLQALVDSTRVDLPNHTGPSTTVGCALSAGLAAATAAKILLQRGDIIQAPNSVHIDAFLAESRIIERPGGMAHPAMQAAMVATMQRLGACPT